MGYEPQKGLRAGLALVFVQLIQRSCRPLDEDADLQLARQYLFRHPNLMLLVISFSILTFQTKKRRNHGSLQ